MREVYSRREAIVASLLGISITAIVWGPVLLRPFGFLPLSTIHPPSPSEPFRAPQARLSMSPARVAKAKPSRPVDINRADALRIQTLPGIGPTLATRIVRHRQVHGPFQGLDGLLDVEGIGSKRLQKLMGWIVVR
ncbi:MAG: helix-hairpin-helix domain-containing protein [Candidatus Methylomirabilis oxyfera]|nr:helix-hairpin-helix domain-containing protein [Candidatus Methylomirabilis oxyfera]